ncbi:hypothetical protein Bbelb_284280 [Branchiostoma belcheri]|nr:hypothetical protein Bbelb_284280 [Branchiostoma belcheri]
MEAFNNGFRTGPYRKYGPVRNPLSNVIAARCSKMRKKARPARNPLSGPDSGRTSGQQPPRSPAAHPRAAAYDMRLERPGTSSDTYEEAERVLFTVKDEDPHMYEEAERVRFKVKDADLHVYEEAERVRFKVKDEDLPPSLRDARRQPETRGPPSRSPAGRQQGGFNGPVRHDEGGGASDNVQEDQKTSSYDDKYPADTNDGTNIIRILASCKLAFCCSLRFITIAIAVLALLGAGAGIVMYFTGTLGGPAEINMPSVVTDQDNWTTALPVTTTVTATYLPVTLTDTAFLSATKLHRATNMFPPSNETATTPIPTAQTTSHDVVRAGKLPPVTTTLPHVTTTLPHVTTTLPHVTTTLPHVTTTLPPVTTTLPRVTTTLPQLTTKPPKMQCSKLTPPAKGSMTGSNSFRDKVYFRCDRGYQLVGDSPLTCQSDGTWSGTSPTCIKAAVCPGIHLANGGSAGSRQTYLRFFCEEGYTLDGASLLTCRPDGTWSGNPPTCRAAVCPGIRPPANGGYNGSAQVLKFFCEEGYTLVGASLLTCQSDGTWTGNPPTCRAKCMNGYQLLAQTCIKVYSYEKDYAEALAVCEKDGATLAMPKTRELDVSLRNLIRKVGVSLDYWIGLVNCDDIWKWADGSRLENYKPNTLHSTATGADIVYQMSLTQC